MRQVLHFLEVMFESLCAVAASLKKEAISSALFRKSSWSEQMRRWRRSWLYGRLSLQWPYHSLSAYSLPHRITWEEGSRHVTRILGQTPRGEGGGWVAKDDRLFGVQDENNTFQAERPSLNSKWRKVLPRLPARAKTEECEGITASFAMSN